MNLIPFLQRNIRKVLDIKSKLYSHESESHEERRGIYRELTGDHSCLSERESGDPHLSSGPEGIFFFVILCKE